MKTRLVSILITICLLLCSSAFALTIEDVGTTDRLVDWTYLNKSSDLSELNYFAEYISGFNVENHDVIKYTPSIIGADFWIEVDGNPDLWAFEFMEKTPSHFLLKTGKLKYDDDTFFDEGIYNYFLYENIGSLQYGVVDLSVFGPDMNLSKISHVSIPAPEPSTFLLLGSGLAGLLLVVVRRRRS